MPNELGRQTFREAEASRKDAAVKKKKAAQAKKKKAAEAKG